jgi:hypothetical protein
MRAVAMKVRLLTLPLVCFTVLTFSAVSARPQTVVTFDDLVDHGGGTMITNAYQGLTWSNFGVVNSILVTTLAGYTNGYYYGMASPSNVAFCWAGNPAEIDSPGTNFNFLTAYLTGAWCSNLNIEVEGFNGATLLYSNTVVASATNATLFTFNYMDIDRLYFDSYGGEPAFGVENDWSSVFIMDNFMFEFIPEPSSLLLTALGAVTLCAFLKRKRV